MARPRRTNPVFAGSGAAVGAMMGGPLGALIGAALGSAVGQETPTLQQALSEKLAGVGAEFVSLRTLSRFAIELVYRDSQGIYRAAEVSIVPSPQGADIDDQLYDQTLTTLGLSAP